VGSDEIKPSCPPVAVTTNGPYFEGLLFVRFYRRKDYELDFDSGVTIDAFTFVKPNGRPNAGRGEAAITVDNIKVAYSPICFLTINEICDVIDTITSKAVLILGRFSEERKPVLDAIRDELRKPEHNYLPIVFDFQPSANQTTIETVKILRIWPGLLLLT
jgi:hypothetical protein